MKSITSVGSLAAAVLVGGAMSASASLIDFTDGSLSGSEGGGWTLSAINGNLNNSEAPNAGCIAESGGLACLNDGVGVNNDEIADGSENGKKLQGITLTFNELVTLTGFETLDLYISGKNGGETREVANLSKGDTIGAVDASLAAVQVNNYNGTPSGYAFIDNLSIKGTSFTFWTAGQPNNDSIGFPDYALAAVSIEAVPLPAGIVLLGTALGGLGLARRKQKAA